MSTSLLLERTDELLQNLYQQAADPMPTLLFDTTELTTCAEQSPIWVEAQNTPQVLQLMHDAPHQWPGLIIESQAPAQILLAHLRHILLVRFDQQRKGVLRYSNPTTASYFFNVEEAQTTMIWLGPISRLRWYGGTWADQAQDQQRWLQLDNPQVAQWAAIAGQPPLYLSPGQERALALQQKQHFLYQWWAKQHDVPFALASRYLDQGLADGFLEAQELQQYLTLRVRYPAHPTTPVARSGNSEERLEQLRRQLQYTEHNKESLI